MATGAQAIQTWGGAAIGVFGQFLTAAQIATVAASRQGEPVTASYPVSQQVMGQIMTNHPSWFTNGSMVSDDLLAQEGGASAAATANPGTVIPITAAQPVLVSQSSASPTSTATLVAPVNTAATGNWFTDPTQEMIAGVPNWGLAAGAGLLLLLLLMKKK